MSTSDTIPMGWRKTTLGDVSRKITKGTTPTTLGYDFVSSGVNFIKVEAITEDGKLIANKFAHITEKTHLALSRSIVEKDDVLFSIAGAIGRSALVSEAVLPANTNQAVAIVRPDPASVFARFLGFMLQDKKVVRFSNSIVSQSVQANINLQQLGKLEICLPPLLEQKSIAAILASLDDKIELLRAENETLEAIAQEIFNEWFVKPTASGSLPEGWRKYRIEEIADVVSGYSYKGADLVESSTAGMVNLKNFDRSGGFKTNGLKPIAGSPKTSQEVKSGDVVVAHTDITQDAAVLGNVAMIFDTGGFDRLYISMDVAKIVPKVGISNGFMYFLMRTSAFKQHCVSYANGTTVLHLPRIAVPEYEIPLPADLSTSTIRDFNVFSSSITKKIIANMQSLRLTATVRDALLPYLINGEVRVKP